ncbi:MULTISPECIES: virulence protein [unclassified Agarivorans]|uniref:virulence protein n=1 Tax=unclassified Agarivorans TaxID=2636026 RepID=UPI0026E1771C|nr:MULTISPECIES: virulence protein [unclassified Agarivorans]MDO6684615.1 virulence protein [Agarivorans sp. 3_MG-2023]MDO6714780.1 virulence protein [Agarivorans sp. 2_MG-2023]MDO6762829.1 virulence protein [Agarivorans sp. 1_MG-2023]
MKMLNLLRSLIAAALLSPLLSVAESVLEPTPEAEQYDAYFPIWAQEAIDLGHKLPKPYGFSINYMSMSQPLIVDSVAFSGLGDVIDNLVGVDGSHAIQESETLTLRGDVWVLPFLNVYGLLGQTKGSSVANVQVNLAGNPIGPAFDFNLEFSGITYGAGTTLVGGIDNWFALLDVNYTNTDLDILDGEISTIVVTPRVGYRWETGGRDIQVWGGAMYQNVEQTFSGNLDDIGINLPPPLPSGGKFTVTQHLEERWNALIGGQMSLTEHVDALLEVGFGKRSSFMLGLGYRF